MKNLHLQFDNRTSGSSKEKKLIFNNLEMNAHSIERNEQVADSLHDDLEKVLNPEMDQKLSDRETTLAASDGPQSLENSINRLVALPELTKIESGLISKDFQGSINQQARDFGHQNIRKLSEYLLSKDVDQVALRISETTGSLIFQFYRNGEVFPVPRNNIEIHFEESTS